MGSYMFKWDGHKTTLTCKKKKKLYTKLSYYDHLNKNVEHSDL